MNLVVTGRSRLIVPLVILVVVLGSGPGFPDASLDSSRATASLAVGNRSRRRTLMPLRAPVDRLQRRALRPWPPGPPPEGSAPRL